MSSLFLVRDVTRLRPRYRLPFNALEVRFDEVIGEGVFLFTCLGEYAGDTSAGVAGMLKDLTDSLGTGHTFTTSSEP